MKYLSFLLIFITLSGCQTPYTGLEQHVVHTPRYNENKVFYVEELKKNGDLINPKTRLVPLYENVDQTATVEHNEPLSIIVDNIALPKELNQSQTYDIAVLLDVAGADGKNVPLAVWYQRGVKPDQTLNFTNLNVFSQDTWDSRRPPYFRMRVINVKQEKSKETLELLSDVNKFSGSLAAYAANPLVAQMLSTGFKAANYVLAHTSNELLLDYSVQLYSGSIDAEGGSHLGKLRKGSYIAMGRPLKCGDKACGRDYWNHELKLSRRTLQLLNDKDEEVDSPFFLMTVVTADTIVPAIVMERTAAIFKHLTDLGSNNSSEEIAAKAQALEKSLHAYSVNEQFYRNRDKASLERMITKINGKDIDNEGKSFLLRTVNKYLPKDQKALTETDALTWWEDNKNKCDVKPNPIYIDCTKD